MHRIRSRSRALIAAGLASIAVAAIPAAASATVTTRGTAVQTQRESLMRYLYGLGFGGTVDAISPGVFARNTSAYSDDTLTVSFTSTGTTYDIPSRGTARGVIALDGGIDYEMSAHYIEVSLDDYQIELDSPTDSEAIVTAVVVYDPFETSGPQLDNDTTPTRLPVFKLDLSSSFSSSGSTHSWRQTTARLTADGARAFNGGTNGSYSENDPFGAFTFSAGY